MSLLRYSTSLALVLVAGIAVAQHTAAPSKDDAGEVPLIENLGSYQHAIRTDKPLAQEYFNQGLRLMYGFNHDEAIRAFRTAAKIDPQSPMAQWGIALALGPNYNAPADEERAKSAYEAVQLAKKLCDTAAPNEAAYVEALSQRYAESPDAERGPLDKAYVEAMRKLSRQYPDDLDAAVLFAEALMDLRPWDLWTPEGKPQPGTEEIVATLESVLARNPDHPGANHFYIHAVEASPSPERALPSAQRLGGLMPGAGHMVHMPAHIYIRLGRYREAVDANKRAVEVDRQYIERYKPQGIYPSMYYPHNLHFLWSVLSSEGRSAEAIQAAGEVVKMIPPEMIDEMPMLEYFVPTQLYAWIRFRRWDEILSAPRPADDLDYVRGMWHYARGLAYAAGNQLDQANREQDALNVILAATPDDLMFTRHKAADLLRVASYELRGKIEARRGNTDAAIATLKKTVELEDALEYSEPPTWYFPERQALGALLLEAKRPAEAEAVYREDLKRNPENGWSLHGLEKSLRAQHKDAEANAALARLQRAWARADSPPY